MSGPGRGFNIGLSWEVAHELATLAEAAHTTLGSYLDGILRAHLAAARAAAVPPARPAAASLGELFDGLAAEMKADAPAPRGRK